ncbi:hypothetical protein [Rhizobium gallicum]|uniref:hypothetical protein n=1 Tax=Rhizobium gallicum TaxID=56730 RepID=UPI001EF7D967|nr:hypothetical protein [Rhizobium gallicum]ULJ72986.1 hypothetical protein L2W42_04880 [Rhizobium gallicum]
MKEHIAKRAAKASAFAAARPYETRWSLIGAGAGFLIGLLAGGVGIAAMGGAVGIPAALILALVGGAIGNRYGISKDRPVDR